MNRSPRLLAFVALLTLGSLAANGDDTAATVRLACVGDSITFGFGTSHQPATAYPGQLAQLLGPRWNVQNDGVSGTTLLTQGDRPYVNTPAFANALAFQPDVVVIMLGTNDTKRQNWALKDQFVGDYEQLIGQFQALTTHPRIYICLPVPVTGGGRYAINELNIEAEIPMIRQVAQNKGVQIIDLHTALQNHDADFPDNVHPNDAGAHLMAQAVAQALEAPDRNAPGVK